MEHPVSLIINPGSTSTKIAVYEGFKPKLVHTSDHTREELSVFERVADQESLRFGCISGMIETSDYSFDDIDIVMGRGGLLHPLEGGVYLVEEQMLEDLRSARYGEHPCNLGGILAMAVAGRADCSAYIADPVVVDELTELARVSGMPEIPRKSIFHALNHKIAAREVSAELGKPYEQTNLIVAHLGGGISIAAHEHGKVIDVNNALDGEGPFTPERSGGLPAGDLVRLAVSGTFSPEVLQGKICGHGGVWAYLGTSDMRIVEQQALDGDELSLFYIQAMMYQVAKDIGAMATVLKGAVDALVITGGLAKSEMIIEELSSSIAHIAPMYVIPGEREMLSLAENASAVYHGTREVRRYEKL